MGYVIHLETYEGPFDLLLDLIEKQEIDILDIPIAVITQQYLEYLYSLQERDLAISGEFLVMAATLLQIKAKMLVPSEPDIEEEQEEADPREELVEQLLRYKFFRHAAAFLWERYSASVGHYTRGYTLGNSKTEPIFTNLVGDITPQDLSLAYRQLIVEKQKEPPTHSIVQRVSVQERLAAIRIQLVGQSTISFTDLLREQAACEVVVTFLAILELVRLGEVQVRQASIFGDIQVTPRAHLEVIG